MKVCGFCDCLLRPEEEICPFCDAVLRDAEAPKAVTVLGLAAALSACGPSIVDGHDDESGGSTSSSGSSPSPSTTTANPTTITSSSTLPATTIASSSGSDEATDISGFLDTPDGGSAAYGQCDVWAQDCPVGEKCMPWANDGGTSWNATRCSAIPPDPQLPGESCTVEGSPWSGHDDCDGTSMCFHADPETNLGSCVSFCQGNENDPVCDDPTDGCLISHEGVLVLCLDSCDPIAQDCPDGMSCVAGTYDFVCVDPGTVELGDDCLQPRDCAPGLSCVRNAFADCDFACCTEVCDPADPACPDPGQSCDPLGDAGVCADPD